jgi:SAM-dependent methyltransferase
MDEWKKIWNRKGSSLVANLGLEELIGIDGFDTGAGKFPTEKWLANVSMIEKRLNIEPGTKMLEIGCGAGAFLFPLVGKNIDLYGIDYSKNLINLACQAIPSGTFFTAEANKLDFENCYFDYIVSNSIFQYFANITYAENVMDEISRVIKGSGKIALLDINDAEKKQEYESIRRGKLGAEEYEKLYSGLSHMFYERSWFEETAHGLGLDCGIEDVNIEGYENSNFRYNVFLKKN